jgi:hypothetical protein
MLVPGKIKWNGSPEVQIVAIRTPKNIAPFYIGIVI